MMPHLKQARPVAVFVAACLLVLVSCSDGPSDGELATDPTAVAAPPTEVAAPTAPTPVPQATSVPESSVELVTLEWRARRCVVCGYLLEVTSDGATFSSNGLEDQLVVDPTSFGAATADLAELLLDSERDCLREADGNADFLTIDDREIDLCFRTPNSDHPLMLLVSTLFAEGRALQPLPKPIAVDALEDPLRWMQLLENQNADWPEFVDPAMCEPTTSSLSLPFGSAWLAFDEQDDRCVMWFGGETENPLYDGRPTIVCSFPFNHRPVRVAVAEGGPPAIDGLPAWCNYDPYPPS